MAAEEIKTVTPAEFDKRMEACMSDTEDWDEDFMSAQMDMLMEEVLIELGYHEGIKTMRDYRRMMF